MKRDIKCIVMTIGICSGLIAAAGLGNVPAGMYSPAVDEGFLVLMKPLEPGNSMVHVPAETTSQSFMLDVIYDLTVMRVLQD